MLTIDHGAAPARDEHGRFTLLYTLTYDKTRDGEPVSVRRRLPAAGIEHVGKVVNALGDEGQVWNIRVVDSDGDDVTQDFACFQD